MNPAARIPSADSARRAMLSKVHIARKELGLDEATYRAMLTRITGHASAGDCSAAQLRDVLDELKAKGWTPRVFVSDKQTAAPRAPGRQRADTPMAKKARAMWISLAQLGAVRNGSEPALEAFARRQLGVEAMQWADQGECYKLIEALKAMAERAGWRQSMPTNNASMAVVILKERLLDAQCKRLGISRQDVPTDKGFDAAIAELAQAIRAKLKEQDA